MATTYTLTGSLRDLLGGLSLERVRAWVEASEQVITDKTSTATPKPTYLGRKQVSVDSSTGNFTVSGLPATQDANWMPTVAAHRLVVEYRDDTPKSQVQSAVTNWFPLTADRQLADVILADPNFIAAFNVTNFTTLVAQAQSSATTAASSASQSAASAAAAQTAKQQAQDLVLSDLGTTDGQTRALLENPNSQTATAVAASTALATADLTTAPRTALEVALGVRNDLEIADRSLPRLHPNPPTVTISAASAASGIASPRTVINAISDPANKTLNPDAPWRYLGNTMVQDQSSPAIGQYGVRGSLMNHTLLAGGAYGVTTITDEPDFEFLFRGTPATRFRLLIDGMLVPVDPLAPFAANLVGGTTAGIYRVRVTFATRSQRRIELECGASCRFGGMTVVQGSVFIKPPQPRLLIAFVGDSFTETALVSMPQRGPSPVVARGFGAGEVIYNGSGGSGYAIGAANGAGPNIPDRVQAEVLDYMAAAVAANGVKPIVVFQAGLNDAKGPAKADVQAGAISAWTKTRNALPTAEIWVVGPYIQNTNPPSADQVAARSWIKEAYDQQAATLGLMPWVDPYGWLTGTGRVDAKQGNGNRDHFLNIDGAHCTPMGYAYLGGRELAEMRAKRPVT